MTIAEDKVKQLAEGLRLARQCEGDNGCEHADHYQMPLFEFYRAAVIYQFGWVVESGTYEGRIVDAVRYEDESLGIYCDDGASVAFTEVITDKEELTHWSWL